MKERALVTIAAVLLFVPACSSQGGTSQNGGASTAPAPAATNSTGFPLYSSSRVITVRDYTQRVQVQTTQNTVFSNGNGTYSGSEVIAASDASFADLSNWLNHTTDAPPAGFTPLETGTNASERAQAETYGVDYATFQTKQNGKTRGLLVVVLDPERVDQKLGRIIGLVAKYRTLPSMMRAPIDNEAKTRFGMTITQATDPESPIGAALAALGDFQQRNARGIVVIDAVKR